MSVDGESGRKRRRGIVDDSDSEAASISRPAEAAANPPPVGIPGGGAPKTASTAPRRRASIQAKSHTAQKAPKIDDTEKYAYDVINMMKDAHRKDLQANLEGRPALHRLQVIDAVAQRVVRRETQEACIKLGVLQEIKAWLEPLPDRSLPSQKIKKSLLDLLCNMHVSRYDLLSSEVGKVVHFYSRCGKEAKDVRKLAYNLMSKWKTLVIREEAE